jgi:hypothetical protein
MFGLDRTSTNSEQLLVFLEAVAIHEDRTTHYRDHWREQGGLDNLRNARGKLRRQVAVISTVAGEQAAVTPVLSKDNLDDSFDCLNYIGFFIRNARAGNLDGEEF